MTPYEQMTLIEEYYQVATLFPRTYGWGKLSEHITDIIVSVMMTRDKVRPGGSFVTAVVENDLRAAILSGDDECVAHIKIIVLARDNAYVDKRP